MGGLLIKSCLLALVLEPTQLCAQDTFMSTGVAPLEVLVDHTRVPSWILSDEAADSLGMRVVRQLRAAGINARAGEKPNGASADNRSRGIKNPTLIIFLYMIPDGSYFVVTLEAQRRVRIVGDETERAVIAYASRPYVYSTELRDHSPVLKYVIDDFAPLWRAENRERN